MFIDLFSDSRFLVMYVFKSVSFNLLSVYFVLELLRDFSYFLWKSLTRYIISLFPFIAQPWLVVPRSI